MFVVERSLCLAARIEEIWAIESAAPTAGFKSNTGRKFFIDRSDITKIIRLQACLRRKSAAGWSVPLIMRIDEGQFESKRPRL